MDAGAASFRFNFDLQDKAAAPVAAPEPDAPAAGAGDAAAAVGAREEFPSLEPPGADWRAEEVAIGTDGFTLLKADGTLVTAAAATLAGGVSATDLVPGRYEGGLKLWECAVDLALYLRGGAAGAAEAPPPLAGASVLELGCGHGLPGVVAALAGAADVAFQDFNAEVLHALTAPCAAANLARAAASRAEAPPRAPPPLRFFSGDWGALPPLLPRASYDVVLSADTIYCVASQPRLLAALAAALRPRGCALVAAKSYYFGVGGGAAQFAAAAARHGLAARVVARFTDGASNVREILRLEHAAPQDACEQR